MSVNSFVQIIGGCSVSDGNQNAPTAAASCSRTNPDGASASAAGASRSEIGSLGVSMIASESRGFNALGPSTAGVANASFSDIINISSGPSSGILRLMFDLDGTGSIVFDRIQGGIPRAGVNLVTNGFSHTAGNGMTSASFDLNYSLSKINLFVTLGASYSCFGSNTQCNVSLNFFNSATIAGALLFDTNMNPIANALLTSDSGFDYQTGFTNPVPLPAALPLFAGGLGLLGLLGWRRKRLAA